MLSAETVRECAHAIVVHAALALPSSTMPPSRGRPSETFDAMIRVLAPYLGENMARAAVYSHRDRLGLNQRELTRADVDGLLDRLGPGLVVFVGREKTEHILDEVRMAIAPLVKGGR